MEENLACLGGLGAGWIDCIPTGIASRWAAWPSHVSRFDSLISVVVNTGV